MNFRRALLVAFAITVCSLSLGAQTRRFFPDDPIWREPITQNVKNAVRYEPDLAYQTIENLFWRPGDKVVGQRAKNVNTVDEVPDGPYFVNRAGRMRLTPAIVARAANTSNGPAPGKWTIVSAKSDGITPGFTIRDSANQLWFIKFDPPGWRAMATGSEIVAAKLFWAAGYHTAEYHIAQLVPSNLAIGKDTRITPPGEMARPMNQSDIMWLLGRADRDPDGSYRVILSKAAPGRPVGRIKFHGTRADDPNDVVPHEHRRELRGYFVFAAWLNHVDAKGINSLSTLVTVITCSISDRRSAAPQSARGKAGRVMRRSSRSPARSANAPCRSASTSRCGGRRIISSHRQSAACRAIIRNGIPRNGGRTSPMRRSAICGPTTHSGQRQRSPRSTTR